MTITTIFKVITETEAYGMGSDGVWRDGASHYEVLYADFNEAYSEWEKEKDRSNVVRTELWRVQNTLDSPLMDDAICLAEYDINGNYLHCIE